MIDRPERRLKSVEGVKIANQPAPPAYICLTNVSDHYFLESPQTPVLASFYGFKIPDFLGTFSTIRDAMRSRERHLEMFELMQSIEKHSHVPSTFDGELPSSAFSDGNLTRMQVGKIYMAPRPDGNEVPLRLNTATVDTVNREMILAYHDPRTDKAWICRAPMSQAELDDCNEFPDTFFGTYLQQGRKTRTPLELFDFMHESYKNTPKEKLFEWMASAADIAELKNLTQSELSEIYCERCVYSIMDEQQRKSAPKV